LFKNGHRGKIKKMQEGYTTRKRYLDIIILSLFYILILIDLKQILMATPFFWLTAPLCLLLALLLADFFSGLVHWAADTWGKYDKNSPTASWVRPFRHHHIDPQSIVRHNFVERNGSATLFVLPIVGVALFIQPIPYISFVFKLTLILFSLAINLTNQHHAWAHSKNTPKIVFWLQKHHVILNKSIHNFHHTKPFASTYCITTGWLNPFMEKIKFFPTLEVIIYKITGLIPREDDLGRKMAMKVLRLRLKNSIFARLI
jgi:ubiquitin-conjugating enzyme E2 variant